MTRNAINTEKTSKEEEEEETKKSNVTETSTNKNIPRLMTDIRENEYKNTEMSIKIVLKKRKIYEKTIEIKHANASGLLKTMMDELNTAASLNKYKELQISITDKLIEICGIETFEEACNTELKNKTIVICIPQKVIHDKHEQQRLIKFYHENNIFGGHCGTKRLQKQLHSKFYWKGMSKQIAQYVKKCNECQLNKPKAKIIEPLKITETPQKPFDIIVIDLVGPLPTTENNNKYIVTAICELSKYLICIPIPNKEAKTVAKAIVENILLTFGLFKTIKTDLGSEFKNSVIKELCEILQIDHHFSTAYHHETLGSIERNHRSLNEYLRSYLNNDNWETFVKYFAFCYNISYTAANNHSFTPFELVFGKKCTLPENLTDKISPIYNFDNYVKIAQANLQIAHQAAKTEIEKMKQKAKMYYDKSARSVNLKPGEKFLIKKEPYNKFKSIYSGPFVALKTDDCNVYYEFENEERKVHKNRTIKVKN